MKNRDYTSHRELYAFELKRLRTEQGFSRRRFAIMVGISRRYLLRLETSEASPTLEMMERLAAGLDVPVRDMVDFEVIGKRMRDAAQKEGDEKLPIDAEYNG